MKTLLDELAAVGPYFAVAHGAQAPAEGFRPLTELYGDGSGSRDGSRDGSCDGSGSYAELAAFAADVGRRLGTDEARVAASTLQLGLASRLWSLALGAAALGGRVPDLAPDRLHWRRIRPSGSVELWLPHPRTLPGPPADALRETVLDANLRTLDAAARTRFGVSPHVLRGNAASALVGSLRVLLNAGRPSYPAAALTEALLAGPLAGSGTFVHEEGLGVAFARRSCCLYYRVPGGGGGTCSDCVLRIRTGPPA